MHAIRPSGWDDVPRLRSTWRSAVLATHDFLDPAHVAEIERFVSEDYLPGVPLVVAVDAADVPDGFMGLTGSNIDSLLVLPARHGRSIGRTLVGFAQIDRSVLTVDVNEQNEAARGFYRRLGFQIVGRTPLVHAGRPIRCFTCAST